VDLEFARRALDHRGGRGGRGASGFVHGGLLRPAEKKTAPAPAGGIGTTSAATASTDGLPQRYVEQGSQV